MLRSIVRFCKSNYLFSNMGFLWQKVWEIGEAIQYEL